MTERARSYELLQVSFEGRRVVLMAAEMQRGG